MKMALLQLLVVEARVFSTKNYRDFCLPGLFYNRLCTLLRRQHWPGNAPGSGTCAYNKTAVGDGLLKITHHFSSLQDTECRSGAAYSDTTRKFQRLYQSQSLQAHVSHCSGGSADVPGM
jgi:hypothetical protein